MVDKKRSAALKKKYGIGVIVKKAAATKSSVFRKKETTEPKDPLLADPSSHKNFVRFLFSKSEEEEITVK